MKLKSITLLLILPVLMLVLGSCSGDGPSEADIEATVQARLQDAVDTQVKARPDPTQQVIIEEVIVTATPVPKGTSHQSCITLANQIETLNISPSNVLSPTNAELPENSKIIDIYEIIDYSNNKPRSLETHENSVVCRANAKTPEGNYPIEFYLMTENSLEYIVVESQGKRKWILKWAK